MRLVTTPMQNSNPKTTEQDIQTNSGISGVVSYAESMFSMKNKQITFILTSCWYLELYIHPFQNINNPSTCSLIGEISE